MSIKSNLIGIGFFFLILVLGCQPYEYGPLVSIRSARERISQSWNFEEVYQNGLFILNGTGVGTIHYDSSSLGLRDNLRFSMILATVKNDGSVTRELYDGSWGLQEDDMEVKLRFDTIVPILGQERVYKITKLSNSDLWLEEREGSNIIEFRLRPN